MFGSSGAIYNKTRKENISKERKEDEPEEWQKEFSDMQNIIKERGREREEAGQLITSKINHTRNQFCPNIEKVLMEFAKSINGNYQEVLEHRIGCYCVKYYVPSKSPSEYSMFISLLLDRIVISDEMYTTDLGHVYHLDPDLKDFSDVKFANELKNFYLRIHGLTK